MILLWRLSLSSSRLRLPSPRSSSSVDAHQREATSRTAIAHPASSASSPPGSRSSRASSSSSRSRLTTSRETVPSPRPCRRPAVRNRPVHAGRCREPPLGRARVLRTVRRAAGVATHGRRNGRRHDQPMGGSALQDTRAGRPETPAEEAPTGSGSTRRPIAKRLAAIGCTARRRGLRTSMWIVLFLTAASSSTFMLFFADRDRAAVIAGDAHRLGDRRRNGHPARDSRPRQPLPGVRGSSNRPQWNVIS